MSIMRAARTLGQESAWTLSHLTMQKVLYIAHMIHLGRAGRPLFAEAVEAWDYGPVVPSLYHAAKACKSSPVHDMFAVEPFAFDTTEAQAIRDALATTRHLTPSQLVSYTHREGGAWEAHYQQGQRGNIIPNSAILREWREAIRPSDEAVSWASQMADRFEASAPRHLGAENQRAFRTRVLGGDC